MKISHFLLGTIGLAVVASTLERASADTPSYYRVTIWADADPYNYDYYNYPTLVLDETSGVTSATLDTGWRLGDMGSEAKAHSTANLATGELKVYVGARGASNAYYQGTASASASFRDSLSFDLPDGMSSATIAVSLAVTGSYELYQASNSTTYANTSLWFWEPGVSGYLIKEDDTIYDGFGGGGTGVPHTMTGNVVVEEGKEYQLSANLSASVKTQNPANLSYFDFVNTGALDIDMPAGVTFTSGSGVLIPEPSTLTLIGLGLLALAAFARRRR